ncbi:protein phosphatase methylesterase [Terfezia boudieri ATCC MYA-4762]|uniref:Protein phosphatase methylesterase 1 n=1 Tax=Terfezia boudieri ATCC MYA-4762 TaxID=1051890 RepID=A0A3N4LAC2_9PEZI|nr:protein phosphatase methylesterase [Terfezia boudieri ATCC MYA-4762]
MSDLQRDFLRAKLAKLPRMPPTHLQESSGIIEDDEYDYEATDEFPDSSSVSSASSTSTIRAPYQPKAPNTHTPIPWQAHFSRHLHLPSRSSPTTVFSAYLTSPTSGGPLFITHHGAGSSGLSFACLASEIRKIIPSAGILSLDARGHGETVTGNDEDLSLTTLSNDLVEVVEATRAACGWEHMPDLILVGHSLGGAVVTEVAKIGALGKAVQGYAVLDVVEGSAIDALQSMQTYLSTRPSSFPSVAAGIEWHIRSRTIRYSASACASVPALLIETADGSPRPWRWRTDLVKTQPFWEGWFVGLSKKFLEAKGGKLLILAGTDRLDRELMIGQMQGKYQLLVIPEVGHFVHEDAPEKVASSLVEFHKRQAPLVLPPKVGQMM